ncbi:L-alanine exporter AlaE [Cognatishimia sp.]|uniref:L-alanine exporter AlaE n=2 Tax=Cognatishimia sp. TaxID=2211648 RepID=UPI0035597DEB
MHISGKTCAQSHNVIHPYSRVDAMKKTKDQDTGAPSGLRARVYLADAIAMLSFFTVASGLNERFIAGMDWPEVLAACMIGSPLIILTARIYGVWRDFVFRLPINAYLTQSRAFFLDTFVSLSFNVPIYAAALILAGASLEEVVRGCIGVAGLLLFSGRPFGIWLDFVRRRFKVPTSYDALAFHWGIAGVFGRTMARNGP